MVKREDSKRSHLIDATKDLLWECGYEAMSPRLIVERSGAGQGSFYHHFAGKLDLAKAALDEVSAEEISTLDRLFQTKKGPLERIEAYLRVPRNAFKGCRLGRLVHESAIEQDELRLPIKAYLDRVHHHISACLREAKLAGMIKQDMDTESIASMFVAIVQGSYVLARADQSTSTMKSTMDGAVSMLRAITNPTSKRTAR